MQFIAIALLFVSLHDVPTPAGAGSAQPFLFAARDSVLLSWLEPAGSRVALRFARWRGGRWSAPRTIIERDDLVVNWADVPSIVEDANGVLFAHWLQKNANDVRMAISKDGGRTWGMPFLLNRDGGKGEHGFASLAPLPKGGVGVVWLAEAGAMTLRYATVDAAGTIRAETQLDARTCECCATGMALAGGRPLVVYRDRSAEEVRDIAVVRQTASGWSRPRLLHADGWKIAGCPVNGPQVDARGDHAAVAWFTAANDAPHAYAAFSDDGGATFRAPLVVDDGKPLGRVDVVMADADHALVAWLEQTGAGAELRARRISRSGKAEPSIKIAGTSGARGSGVARAAIVGGDLFVAWTEMNGETKRVRMTQIK